MTGLVCKGKGSWMRTMLLVALLAAAAVSGCSSSTPGTINGPIAGPDVKSLSDAGKDFYTGPQDIVVQEDVPAPLPGQFLAPCTGDNDCDSGICIDSADGKVCTKNCGDCPLGYKCGEYAVPGGDKTFVCLPRFKHLCDPCNTNTDCNSSGENGNVCMGFGAAGSFCGAQCDEIKPDCPKGYDCQAVLDGVTGLQSHQCARTAGICECSGSAEQLGLKTTCSNKNIYGTCTGDRICTAAGLGQCGAPVPKPEECNGIDDDCNGKTDDFTDTATCDIKNEFGTCKGKVKDCVGGVAVCDGPQAKPEACNGIDDNCDGQTDEGLCSDGDPCTQDQCNTDGSCNHIHLAGMACDDGSICTQTDKCVAGVCTGGNQMNCDDKDPCTTDSCDPFTGCVHSPASDAVCTDDGNKCTQDLCKDGTCQHPQANDGTACADDGQACTLDQCKVGVCVHTPADGLPCTDDGKPCTDDVCKAGACTHTNGSGACEDGNQCTAGDTCMNGTCLPGPQKSCNDNNPCTTDSCNPSVAGGCVYANNDYAACNVAGSSDCPVGQCAGGFCSSKPNITCSTEVQTDLCGSQPVAGTCTASGKCVPTKAGNTACTIPCNGICVKCMGIQLCIPIG